MEFNEKTHRVCSCCGKAKPKNSFYLNLSQSKEEVSICKTCCFEKYKSLYQITKNIGASLCAVIYQLNLPMLDDVWQITEKEYKLSNHSGQTNIVNIYYKNLAFLSQSFNGNIDSNLGIPDFLTERKNVVEVQKDGSQQSTVVNKTALRSHWNEVWGDFSDEDCVALDRFYENYTEALLDMDTAQELRYRDLCKAELRKRKIDETSGSSSKDSRDATEEILRLMKLLKLDDFKDNKQSETEKFIERMAWKIENEKPAECEDLNKYKDISGFEPTWKEILRCVKNLVAGTRQYPDVPKDEI